MKNVSDKISIKTRFSLLYSFAAFSLLTIIILFLYWESINILYKADYQFLSDEVEAIEHALLHKKIHSADLIQEVMHEPRHPGSIYQYFVRILDGNNSVIMETPGITNINLPLYTHIHKKTWRWHKINDVSYLIVQAPIRVSGKKHGSVQIALNISWQHIVISDRKYLVFAFIISGIASLILGFYITQRSMKSLYLLTNRVKQITARSLNQRIDPGSLPKELKTLGNAFNEMLDRIELSFVRLKQFSSDLAHELRMPISNMIGETEIALSRTHSVYEYQQVLMSNLEEYQRLAHITENILFLSRAENPQLELEKTMLFLHDEIAFICEYYETLADEKNISVTLTGKANLYANSIMFRRLISNLLSNALKYTGMNGTIQFHLFSDQEQVEIKLVDDGIGIAEEHLPKIFDRFYRVDSARSQQSGGTGLGLAIVKSIVDLHRGKISIVSKENTGTEVAMVFPSIQF